MFSLFYYFKSNSKKSSLDTSLNTPLNTPPNSPSNNLSYPSNINNFKLSSVCNISLNSHNNKNYKLFSSKFNKK